MCFLHVCRPVTFHTSQCLHTHVHCFNSKTLLAAFFCPRWLPNIKGELSFSESRYSRCTQRDVPYSWESDLSALSLLSCPYNDLLATEGWTAKWCGRVRVCAAHDRCPYSLCPSLSKQQQLWSQKGKKKKKTDSICFIISVAQVLYYSCWLSCKIQSELEWISPKLSNFSAISLCVLKNNVASAHFHIVTLYRLNVAVVPNDKHVHVFQSRDSKPLSFCVSLCFPCLSPTMLSPVSVGLFSIPNTVSDKEDEPVFVLGDKQETGERRGTITRREKKNRHEEAETKMRKWAEKESELSHKFPNQSSMNMEQPNDSKVQE